MNTSKESKNIRKEKLNIVQRQKRQEKNTDVSERVSKVRHLFERLINYSQNNGKGKGRTEGK